MTPRILIVDDDPDMVDLLRLALADTRCSVCTASDGKEALRKALRSPPDLVVLDLLLPGLNGFSVCEQLRLNPATADVPIVMITVLPGEFPRLVGTEAGADAYLNKPFPMEEFVACVGELIRRRSGGAEVLAGPLQPPMGDAIPPFPVPSAVPAAHLRLRAHN